jgi:hypothetical protein
MEPPMHHLMATALTRPMVHRCLGAINDIPARIYMVRQHHGKPDDLRASA